MKKFYAFIFISLFFFSNTCPMRVAVDDDVALEIDRLERENDRLEQEKVWGLSEEALLRKKLVSLGCKLNREKRATKCLENVNRCLFFPAIIGTGMFVALCLYVWCDISS